MRTLAAYLAVWNSQSHLHLRLLPQLQPLLLWLLWLVVEASALAGLMIVAAAIAMVVAVVAVAETAAPDVVK